jgi:hypothetical protein
MLPEDTRHLVTMELITLLLSVPNDPVFQVGCVALITGLGICKRSTGECVDVLA